MSPVANAISQTTNFLNDLFAQRGGYDCPYEPQFHAVIRQHLLELVGDIPSLTVKQQQYTHHDGRSSRLAVAEGTVPMYYQGVKYNIPVALWLTKRYPLQPPLMYVVPTPDMVIKPRHPFVDPSGLVGSPYLHNWAYPTSNLREMAQDASILFSGDPPLFSKPPGWTPPTSSPPRPPTAFPPQAGPSSGGGGPPGGRPGYPGPLPPLQHQQQQPGSGGVYSPMDFHAQNPIHGSSTPFSGGSFTGGGGPPLAGTSGGPSAGSFTGASGGSFTAQPSHTPYALASDGGLSGWAGALSAAAGLSAATAGAQHPPPPFAQPPQGAPLGSGPPAQQQQQQQQQVSKPHVAIASSASEDASRELRGAFRSAALRTLQRRLAASAAAASMGAQAQVEALAAQQAELERREAQLQQEVAALHAERISLDKGAQELGSAAAQLDQWLAGNERAVAAASATGAPGGGSEAGGGGGVAAVAAQLDPDTVIVAADPLSQQALEAQAQDLALEDALYALDKALNAGLLQPDVYIKQVRGVCRQQFMARALSNKIAAKQNEARRRSPVCGPALPGAAPGAWAPALVAPPQGVQMPVGDSWYNSGILPNPLAAQR